MRTADFDYELPPELIAQQPAPRGSSRLLVLERATGRLEHRRITDLTRYVTPKDLLLLNDTRVIPARLYATRSTGRRFEILLLEQINDHQWHALLRPSARVKPGESLALSDGGTLLPRQQVGQGQWLVSCDPPLGLDRLSDLGQVPLPPYIKRPAGPLASDRERYQTVYAKVPGAVAAPTAGLHFTTGLLDELRGTGVEVVSVTLHVGPGTFCPVSVDLVAQHRMHREQYLISDGAATALNRALDEDRRIVCVGTTVVRTLEGALASSGTRLIPGGGSTDLFITPGYHFRGVGALLTNFHLPRSTLLMLVSAFARPEQIRAAYEAAIAERYRFFSYGDAMLIV